MEKYNKRRGELERKRIVDRRSRQRKSFCGADRDREGVTDGRTDGWMEGREDGRTDGQTYR
jgi:hypothetical protein